MSDDFKPGDWVLVWGQVIDKPAHPEDAVVEFFSHSEQWAGHCRRDRIEAADTPDFALQCRSLKAIEPDLYVRCKNTDGHGQAHSCRNLTWVEDDGGIDQ